MIPRLPRNQEKRPIIAEEIERAVGSSPSFVHLPLPLSSSFEVAITSTEDLQSSMYQGRL